MMAKNVKIYLTKKDHKTAKIKRRYHTYKHIVNILNSFNTKLQVKNNEFAIKDKIKDL